MHGKCDRQNDLKYDVGLRRSGDSQVHNLAVDGGRPVRAGAVDDEHLVHVDPVRDDLILDYQGNLKC